MITPPTHVGITDRVALALMAVVLLASASLRLLPLTGLHDPMQQPDGPARIDLGEGATMSVVEPLRSVEVPSCTAAITVDVVGPLPHGADASLAAPPDPADRVLYAYHGHVFEGGTATMGMSVSHLVRRALGVMGLPGGVRSDDLALRLVVPSPCEASSADVLQALRDARRW